MNPIEQEFDRIVSRLKVTSAVERKAMAEALGVSSSILQKIKAGEVTNPKKNTLVALHSYLFGSGDSENTDKQATAKGEAA